MSHAVGKFIAVILAIWLPLFSGNALAVSIAMQSMGGDCHSAAMQQDMLHEDCASAMQQRMHHGQHEMDMDQSLGLQDQQSTAGDDCGTCHLACCGYLAAVSAKVGKAPLADREYFSVTAQFQSITFTPLDPPPLVRA